MVQSFRKKETYSVIKEERKYNARSSSGKAKHQVLRLPKPLYLKGEQNYHNFHKPPASILMSCMAKGSHCNFSYETPTDDFFLKRFF
jgi:hypothetical protein